MHLWTVAIALVCVGAWDRAAAEVNPLLVEVIYTANQENIKNNKEKMDIPTTTVEGTTYTIKASGYAKNFSTLALIGDDQVFKQTDGEGFSVYDLLLKVGLEEIKVQLDYEYKFLHFFTGSGTIDLAVGKNVIQPKLTITSYDNGTCVAILESAVVKELGDFSIDISPSSIGKYFLKRVTSFVLNYMLPLSAINSKVADIVVHKVPESDFSKTVCKPFVI